MRPILRQICHAWEWEWPLLLKVMSSSLLCFVLLACLSLDEIFLDKSLLENLPNLSFWHMNVGNLIVGLLIVELINNLCLRWAFSLTWDFLSLNDFSSLITIKFNNLLCRNVHISTFISLHLALSKHIFRKNSLNLLSFTCGSRFLIGLFVKIKSMFFLSNILIILNFENLSLKKRRVKQIIILSTYMGSMPIVLAELKAI